MVNDLAKEYARQNKPALFIEHNVENLTGQRISRWYAARGRGGVSGTPMTMVDSGLMYTESAVDFRKVFSNMVDTALARPAGADITAFYQRSGDTINVSIEVTNRSGVPLGYDNYAAVHVLLYEDKRVVHVDHAVRAGTATSIEDDIKRGGTAHFDLQLDVDPKARVNYAKSHVLVLLDYRPEGSTGPYDLLQAALAIDGVPTPTPEPSSTPEPTATDEPTVTPEPTVVPTEAVSRWWLNLPWVMR